MKHYFVVIRSSIRKSVTISIINYLGDLDWLTYIYKDDIIDTSNYFYLHINHILINTFIPKS